jgi:26S proteasome regulatory subunit N2
VSLLSESFNPHVRYGTCMALGIACVASGQKVPHHHHHHHHHTFFLPSPPHLHNSVVHVLSPFLPQDALSLLETMTQDSSPIVRQGALVATALVMMNQPVHHPKVLSSAI